MEKVPIVDIGRVGLNVEKANLKIEDMKNVGEQIVKAFTEIGFVYITNHGVPEDTLIRGKEKSAEFFSRPLEEKMKIKRQSNKKNDGYVYIGMEVLDREKHKEEIKECYNMRDFSHDLPKEVQGFNETAHQIYNQLQELSDRMLLILQIGLGLKENVLVDSHKEIGKGELNPTTLRFLHYPPITAENVIDVKSAVRCGEHSDYGTITFLYQDKTGGLEVRNREGNFIFAPAVEGALLVNVGDLFQRWTSDLFVASVHRVQIPPMEKRHLARYSMAFFVHPDHDTVVECLDGSGKYEPIRANDHLISRFNKTYV